MVIENLPPISAANHTANVAAVGFPLAAWLGTWIGFIQPIAALILTMLGIVYYVRIFYRDWKGRRGQH